MRKRLNPLLFVPGALFWVFVIVGATTHNDVLIGVGIGILVVTLVTGFALKIRSSAAEKRERQRVWHDGEPGQARVIAIGTNGGSFNDHPYVDMELEVTVGEKPAYRAKVRALISQLAIPRIQPECRIAVRVDRADTSKVLVDSALTPYGYD